jgi:hypothetical protein
MEIKRGDTVIYKGEKYTVVSVTQIIPSGEPYLLLTNGGTAIFAPMGSCKEYKNARIPEND